MPSVMYSINNKTRNVTCFSSALKSRSPIVMGKNNFLAYLFHNVRRDSAIDIATGYELDDRGVGVRVPVGSRIFSFQCRPDRLWGPPSLLSNGYQRRFPHSPPTSTEIKKTWIYTSIPPYVFMAYCLIS
jgi:hypothetical protein